MDRVTTNPISRASLPPEKGFARKRPQNCFIERVGSSNEGTAGKCSSGLRWAWRHHGQGVTWDSKRRLLFCVVRNPWVWVCYGRGGGHVEYVEGDGHVQRLDQADGIFPSWGEALRGESLTTLCKSGKSDYLYLLFTPPPAFCKVLNLKCKGVTFFWRYWGGIKDNSEVIKASPGQGCACVLPAVGFPEPP